MSKKRLRVLGILLICTMLLSALSLTALADETTGDTEPETGSITIEGKDDTYTTVADAVNAADNGDTVILEAENYDIGSLVVQKAVSFKGDAGTTITGSIKYTAFTDDTPESKTITIENVAFAASEDNKHLALCLGSGVTGYTLNVTGCTFDGWEYAIAANSGASGNTLNVDAVTIFNDVFCAVSAKLENNTINVESSTDGASYAVQVFGTHNGESFDSYYETAENYEADEDLSSPDVGGNTSGDGKVIVATPTNFESRVASAQDGDTIELAAGEYNIGALNNITKAVSFKGAGADKTILNGSMMYKNLSGTEESDKTITVEGITLQSGEETDDRTGLTLSQGVSGYTLYVEDCIFDGWQYAVSANTQKDANNKLSISGTTFTDTGCAVSVRDGNTVESFTDSTCDGYAVQYFNGQYSTPDVNINGYYETLENYQNDTEHTNPDFDATASETKLVFSETDLQNAVTNAGTTAVTIELAKDIALTGNYVNIPENANITIEGNGNTISFDFDVSDYADQHKAIFSGTGVSEGIPAGVTLTVRDVTIKNISTTNTSSGYAAIVSADAEGTTVSFDKCAFENLYCGVYVNWVTDPAKAPVISITNSTYTDTTYGYSVDEVTNGAVVGGVETTFENNTGDVTEAETWQDAVAATVISGDVAKAYSSWENAYNAADENGIIILQKNITGPVTIDKAVTIVGNGNTITAESGDAITVTAAGVTLSDVNATAQGGHALVVYSAYDNANNSYTPVNGDIAVNGGIYVAENASMQGEGAIRIFASGTVTVKDTTTTGGIHVFNPASYEISGNNVSFDGYNQKGVGILV